MNDIIDVNQCLALLNKTYAELVENGLNPKLRFWKLFPGDDDFYLEPLPGVIYKFEAKSKVLQSINVCMIKRVEEQPEFKGSLTSPYGCLTQEMVRENWGDPVRSRGPFRLPSPVGQTGGWDMYSLASQGYEDFDLVYQYVADLRVSGIAVGVKKDED